MTMLTIHVDTWRNVRELLWLFNGFAFRGHANAEWELQSTLWREISREPAETKRQHERLVLQEFQRRAHHFVANPPANGFTLEWMTLLRHFGGPSRALDLTRSPYVAAFFALDQAARDKWACIWAIRERAINVRVTEKLKKKTGRDIGTDLFVVEDGEHTVAELMDQNHRMVTCVAPSRLNERIAIQQGLILLPLSLDDSIYVLLLETLDIQATDSMLSIADDARSIAQRAKNLPNISVAKIEFPGSIRDEALRDLRLMNVSAATLYPGLEGFAQSLRTRLSIGDF
jgi:hypothetical protein